jgi:probable HAF family extracellular repeat protein
MKRIRFLALILFAGLIAGPPRLAAQRLPHYTVIDLGTLGGTYSVANGISNDGWVSGISTLRGDTAQHAFLWRRGRMIDLGTLGGPNSNNYFLPNDWGEVVGPSETSNPDPLGEDYCGFGTHLICLPFVWWSGIMIPLPTLGGYNGGAAGVNDQGEVVGAAENTTSDPTCVPPQIRQIEPVIWRAGRIHQLPNFPGDTVGAAHAINDKGQITGWSGNCAMTLVHAVLWENGRAIYLGSLGGTGDTEGLGINNQGQVVGYGYLAGNTTYDAFLWRNGVMTDLGTLPGDVASGALAINSKGQVVGGSVEPSQNVRGVIWQNGVITDLNTLIPPDSPFIMFASGINSGGQITAAALLASGQTHAVLMTPSEGDASEEGAAPMARSETTQRPDVALPEIVRQLLQRQAPFGQFKGSLIRPQ